MQGATGGMPNRSKYLSDHLCITQTLHACLHLRTQQAIGGSDETSLCILGADWTVHGHGYSWPPARSQSLLV